MSELSRETDALLQQGRDGESITPHDRSRLKRALLAQVAGASVVATTTTAAAWTTVAAKVAGVVVLVGSVAGAVAVLPSRTPPAAKAVARAPVTPTTVVTPATRLAPQGAPTAARLPAPPAPSSAVPVVSAVPVPPAGPVLRSSLDQETALLHDADDALKALDAGRALRLLDEHAARFPGSPLAPERAAERVSALCMLGRSDEARAAADDFLHAQNVGPLAARVRASCGGAR